MLYSSLGNRQRELRERLIEVAKCIEQRVQAIRHSLDQRNFASEDTELRQRLEQNWYPRLQELETLLQELKSKCDTRPSLVVVGKRGQGKSTLIQNWIGSGIRVASNNNPLPLPTGVEETTCALVRLSSQPASYSSMLEIHLLPEDALPMVTKRPPRPPGIAPNQPILLSRHSPDPHISPFWVMRYPSEGRDDQVYAERRDGYYELGRTGSIPLTSLQYHVAEVKVPFLLEELTGHTAQLLQVVDIVDAPGADPAGRGDFPDWIRNKNKEVFKLGAPRIDLLLLVSSIEVAAINLGGQMQDEILQPWRQRCQGRVLGRMAIVITHAADLFHEMQNGASRRLSEDRSPTRKIVTNILEQLENLGFLKVDGDIEEWPPIFFVENNRTELQPYLVGWMPDPQRESRLRSLLRGDPASWEKLPIGERIILWIADDWRKEYQDKWRDEKITQLQDWTIHALCRLLDEDDQGLGLLTEFIQDWAERGPVAENYWSERITCYERLRDKFAKLLQALNEPDYHTTLHEIQGAQRWLKERWNSEEIVWKLGEHCRERIEQAKINSGPHRSLHKEFSFDDALADLVEDVLDQLEEHHQSLHQGTQRSHQAGQNKGAREAARTVLQRCLSRDFPTAELRRRYESLVSNDVENLARVQAFGLERLTRILDYLTRAHEPQLRAVLRHCYGRDLSLNVLIRGIYRDLIEPHLAEDQELLQRATQQCQELLAELRQQRFRRPYRLE